MRRRKCIAERHKRQVRKKVNRLSVQFKTMGKMQHEIKIQGRKMKIITETNAVTVCFSSDAEKAF